MPSSSRRALLICLVGAMSAVPLGCAPHGGESPSVTTDAGAGGNRTTSGAGGAGGASSTGGGLPFDAGGTSTGGGTCVFPSPDDPAGYTGIPAQSWCAPATANPPGCPLEKPLPGAACSASGLQCAYAKAPEGLLLETCGQAWMDVARGCTRTCAPSGTSVATPQQPACGALADIQCAGGAGATDQERADRTLGEIAACCGGVTETILVVWLQDGCASAASGPPALVSCMNGLLAGRRLDCAKGLSCATYEWSTLP